MAKNYLHLSRNAYISNTAAMFFAASFDYSLEASITKATTLADLLEKKGLATWTPQPQEKPKKEEPKKPETVLTAKIILDYEPGWGTLTIRNKSEFHLGIDVDNKVVFWLAKNDSVMTTPRNVTLNLPMNINIKALGREEFGNTLTITKPGVQEFLVDLKANGGAK